MGLINIQGLTKQKMTELEQMFNSDCDILCLTETHQRYDKLLVDSSLVKLESMRKEQDKKGGGLMIVYKRTSNIKLEVMPSRNADILDVQGTIAHKEVRIILIYMSVENQPQDIDRNKGLQREIEHKIENTDDRALMILGDFNGHVGFLGNQREDRNGKFIIDLVNNSNMVMLNCDDKCQGLYTWGKRSYRSVIDYVLANGEMYQHIDVMEIDEKQQKFDLSDHNLITVAMTFETHTDFRKASIEEQHYFKVDEQSLKLFAEGVQRRIDGKNIVDIEELNAIMKAVAEEELKALYRRKISNKHEDVKEKPWVTEQVKKAIKTRKALNRKRRNATTGEEEQKLYQEYQNQKKATQKLIKEEISKHERKVTDEIRKNSCKSKALWENISKLRGNQIARNKEIHLFTEEGKPMEEEEEQEAFHGFWESVYQKHKNRIDEVWNSESKEQYEQDLANQQEELEFHGCSFPRELREHLDMIGHMERPPSRMIEPYISTGIVSKCVQSLKNKTSAGPDEIKPELYKAMLLNETCLQTMTQCFQEELKKDSKPASWKTSRTKMIPKVSKPMAKDLRPIALTNVSYKLYMSILKEYLEQYLLRTEGIIETQAGFTRGGRIEDNLLILQYCVEDCYKTKKPLIVVSIDYSKAFDSIDRAKMIEVLMKYRVHPRMIDSVAAIYTGDSTTICLNSRTRAEIHITSGIRQGCTGSTSFFKLLPTSLPRKLSQQMLGTETTSSSCQYYSLLMIACCSQAQLKKQEKV